MNDSLAPLLCKSILFKFCVLSYIGRDPCSDMQCEHLCILTHITDNEGLGARCGCDSGFVLKNDRKTCSRK